MAMKVTFRTIFTLFLAVSVHGSGHLEVRDVGTDLQLFVDDWLVDSLDGVYRQLHRPRAGEVAIQLDRPWEGLYLYDPSVMKDGSRYRMWYRGGGPSRPHLWAYAESADGIHWVKPELNLIEFKGSRKNNLVWPVPGGICSTLAIFKDPNPETPPDERYKSICTGKEPDAGHDRPVIYGLVSPDGLRWRMIRERKLLQPPWEDGALDSHNIGLWDPGRGHYAIYARGWYRRGSVPYGSKTVRKELYHVTSRLPSGTEFTVPRIRDIRRFTSKDFLNWSEPEYLQYRDTPDEHLYKNAAVPYYRRPDLMLMFPKRFLPERVFDPDWPGVYMDPWANAPDCSSMEVPGITWIYGCAGLSDIVFMFSRDGIRFTRFREAFIRPGRDVRNWHGRAIEVGPTLVPTGDGEMSLYYVEHYGTQSVKIRRGVLREDGFVSLQGDFQGGTARTRPFRFSGSRLTLNYSTSAAGSLRVEIQDERGDPLEGYGLDDCKLIFGDELQRTVKWKGGSDLSALAGQTVRMKIEIRDGDLFSLQFH